MLYQNFFARYIISIFCLLFCYSLVYADNRSMTPDELRQWVEKIMQSKVAELEAMNRRINELEKLTRDQRKLIQQLQTNKYTGRLTKNKTEKTIQSADSLTQSKRLLTNLFFPETRDSTSKTDENEGPGISGFFNTLAQTPNGSNQVFHIGVVELDIDRIFHQGDFAASIALDWIPYGAGTPPNAQIGAAFVDFHLYDTEIPLRGRIFQEPGFHLQAGQFDLPFGSDYQYFAVMDRFTITQPMTASRIQQTGINPGNGGFNSAGVRTYGKWHDFTYAVYGVNSIFSNGLALGGRMGYSVNSPFSLHSQSDLPLLDFGLSYLNDLDQSEHTTDQLYAIDLSFNYKSFHLNSEFVRHDAKVNRHDGNPVLNESAFHVTLMLELHQWLHDDWYVYSRYQEWHPDYTSISVDNSNVSVGFIPMVTVGFGYHINDFLTFKIEYNDSLDYHTAEPTFQSQTGIAELVGSF